MALSIITDKFRIENAKKFVQSIKNRPYPSDFSTSQTDYEREKTSTYENELDALYMFIGKITTWYNENNLPVGADTADTPVPDAYSYLRQESEIWANTIVAKKVEPTNVKHVIQREDWQASSVYPFYRSDASNTTTFADPTQQNFYVLDTKEYRVYKCLYNFYGSESQQRPTEIGAIGGDPRRFGSEPFETSDGYVWKYMYTIDPADAINFVTENYIPVQKDSVNDDGSDSDNSSIDGAIYRIALTDKSQASDIISPPSSTGSFVRIRLEDVVGSTDLNATGNELTIDLLGDNAGRIASTVTDDMVNYQVEHLLSDNTIEIGRIVASSVTTAGGGGRESLTVTIERVDSDDAGFTETTGDSWFIAPHIEVRGEGQNASALLYINNEPGFDVSTRKLYPSAAVTTGDAYDVIVNSVGYGYRNIYFRNDTDGTLNSYVKVLMGSAEIGSTTEGSETLAADREIENFAHIVSITPFGGHSYDNISELYGYTIMVNHTFSGDESGSATVANDFRQIALIQNPLEQIVNESTGYTIADAAIYRQTIRLEFNGDLTSTIHYDDEISDKSSVTDIRTVHGRVVEFTYNSVDDKTLVYLSSTSGFFERTAQEIYDLDASNRLFLSYDVSAADSPYTALTLSDRLTTADSDGEYQKGIGSGIGNPGLSILSGDVLYMENRQPIIRVADQSENIKLIIEY